MRPFEVTTKDTPVNLGPANKTDVTFSVSNVSGRALRANFVLVSDDPSKSSWLALKGPPSNDFSKDSTTLQVPVSITAPAGASPGTFTFKLLALSAERPEEDRTEGPTVAFTVGPTTAPKANFPWWVVAVALVIVVIGGGSAYFATRPHALPTATPAPATAVVPPVHGMSLAAATNAIVGAGLQVTRVCGSVEPAESTSPAENTTVTKGSGVTVNMNGTICIRWIRRKYVDPSSKFQDLLLVKPTPTP